MQGGTYLVLAYIAIWLGMLAYVGWLALRQRGISVEIEALRQLVERRSADETAPGPPADSQ